MYSGLKFLLILQFFTFFTSEEASHGSKDS